MTVDVRLGAPDDLPALTEIYNHYIRTSHATFDLDELTVEARRGWFDDHSVDDRHVLLVADIDGSPAGYATSSQFRVKAAYDSSVETTVYVAPGKGGQGIGRALYDELIRRLVAVPTLHRAYAGVALPNPASTGLHLACGFASIGTFTEAGYKLGRHVDVQWFERSLDH
ncbi:GNAT family N-acetyltransferase [Aeromicrobium panaciterrae]|uniref:GNAT family N-acetyltransferase n=1 Tax=Aeromicrobium panaciterrae TaxID=363861 RepID=UPI0031E38F07